MLVFANLVNGRITDVGGIHVEAALVDGLGDFLFESHRSGILRLCNSVRGNESKKFHSCRLLISRKTFSYSLSSYRVADDCETLEAALLYKMERGRAISRIFSSVVVVAVNRN
jgi:hypothetical protein